MSKINVELLSLNCNHWAYFSKDLNDLNSRTQSVPLSLKKESHLVMDLMNNLLWNNRYVNRILCVIK